MFSFPSDSFLINPLPFLKQLWPSSLTGKRTMSARKNVMRPSRRYPTRAAGGQDKTANQNSSPFLLPLQASSAFSLLRFSRSGLKEWRKARKRKILLKQTDKYPQFIIPYKSSHSNTQIRHFHGMRQKILLKNTLSSLHCRKFLLFLLVFEALLSFMKAFLCRFHSHLIEGIIKYCGSSAT